MKKILPIALVLILLLVPNVVAGTGSLRIDPQWPTMLESPADFTVWCQTGTSYDVSLLLVITDECYAAMPDGGNPVVVTVTGDVNALIYKSAFEINVVTGMGGVYVPDIGATPGAQYTVASLKDHLDYGLSEPLESEDAIRWYMFPLFDSLGSDPKEISITLNSGDPRMLVYLMGKSVDGAELFDMRIPPTPAGFVVPEIAPVLLSFAAFSAFLLFGIYRKKMMPLSPS